MSAGSIARPDPEQCGCLAAPVGRALDEHGRERRGVGGIDITNGGHRDRRCATGVPEERDVPDAASGEGEEHGIAGRVIADPADHLDLRASGGGSRRDPGSEPGGFACCGRRRPEREHRRPDDSQHRGLA